MNKVLIPGNHVIAEAAIRAGLNFFAGYPITPQNEIPEYLSEHLEKAGGIFIQAESEVSAVNMVAGASAAGARAMTSSSSPGISLKQEGISSLAAHELPSLIVNIMRGGPGLGNIRPSQGDYFQATKGGGHGDYRIIVLAPATCQEMADLTMEAFDLADRYRGPVMILADGMMGQMMEPVVFKESRPRRYDEKYVLKGAGRGRSKVIKALILDPFEMEENNWRLARKYAAIERTETRCETYLADDAEIVIIAYGTAARVAKGAIKRLRQEGLKVGLFRPITLWPYPAPALARLAGSCRKFLVFEMSTGQMVEDVNLALQGRAEVKFYGRPGGVVPTPAELTSFILHTYQAA